MGFALAVMKGVFPAYAGMNRCMVIGIIVIHSVPRLRGDEPAQSCLMPILPWCSPPTRG